MPNPVVLLGGPAKHLEAGGASYHAEVLADDPLGFWPMDATVLSVLTDVSGNGNTLSWASGTTAWTSDPDYGQVWWSEVGSLLCPVRCPQTSYTLEIWAYRTAPVGGDTAYIGDWGGIVGTKGAMIYGHAGGISVYHNSVKLDGPAHSTGWRHLVMTWDGSTVRLYVNGSLYGSVASSVTPEVGQESYLSSYGNSPSRFAKGPLMRAAWYDHALSSVRVAAHYAAGVA